MTKSVPEFVLRQGASLADWIERDDRLPLENQAAAYHERNQRDWWEQNRKIRKLLGDIEKQVHRIINAGEIPSVKLVSWLQMARNLSCDRATLKHVRRHYWVASRREQLLALIENAKQQKRALLEPAQPKISELEQLKKSLLAQRTQTGLWYDKCINLEQQISQLNRLLAVRDSRIQELLSKGLNGNHHLAI